MGIRIESVGIYWDTSCNQQNGIEIAKRAALDCLSKSQHDKNEVNLIVNASVYKDHYFAEPAMATFIQRELEINHCLDNGHSSHTLSFDLLNGALGVLDACQLVAAMIESGNIKTALIVSGDSFDLPLGKKSGPLKLTAIGTAMLLDQTPEANQGFRSFYFQSGNRHIALLKAHLYHDNNQMAIHYQKSLEFENILVMEIYRALKHYFINGVNWAKNFQLIIPPQLSPCFIEKLADAIGIKKDILLDISKKDCDFYNASLALAIHHIQQNGVGHKLNKALIICAGSGIQVGLATYTF